MQATNIVLYDITHFRNLFLHLLVLSIVREGGLDMRVRATAACKYLIPKAKQSCRLCNRVKKSLLHYLQPFPDPLGVMRGQYRSSALAQQRVRTQHGRQEDGVMVHHAYFIRVTPTSIHRIVLIGCRVCHRQIRTRPHRKKKRKEDKSQPIYSNCSSFF